VKLLRLLAKRLVRPPTLLARLPLVRLTPPLVRRQMPLRELLLQLSQRLLSSKPQRHRQRNVSKKF
jgi:hypothetical protein